MLTYIIYIFLLCSLCVAEFSEISQPVPFQTAKLGDTTTIECDIDTAMNKGAWYKLTTGNRLQLVAEMNFRYNLTTVPDEFHQRYTVKSGSHLSITATVWEDVGTYFCGVMTLSNIEFGSGTFLMLKGANMVGSSVVQQPAYQSVHPGGSVTLSCSVHTHHCSADHTSFMWLKTSEGSGPEIVYSSENKRNSCQKMEDETTSCVNNLVVKNLDTDAAGTYYCVVISCGCVRFGNGTRIDKVETASLNQTSTFIALILSNIFLGLVILGLIWALCMSWRSNSAGVTGPCEGNQTGDGVIYASAMCLSPRGVDLTQDAVQHSGDLVVYSKIRDFQQNSEPRL
ncbi:uncharacterized protein LOC114866682 [Betta splendens]|uniref:Uncharacterized protein LOC114866682 n=1 Tax=Betta splendens TaxID=158456 RepID=A0A9W2XFV9_BETSP|nr:uncharacterized protein LOC114866682 [Betta splendens]